MKKKFFSIAVVIILAFTPIPQAQASKVGVLKGSLHDVTGMPIENAIISVNSKRLEVQTCTNAKGEFSIQFYRGVQTWLRVDGAKPLSGAIRGCDPTNGTYFSLEAQMEFTEINNENPLNLIAPRYEPIEVIVQNENGAPVEGATVTLDDTAPYLQSPRPVSAIIGDFFWFSSYSTGVSSQAGIATIPTFSFLDDYNDVARWCPFGECDLEQLEETNMGWVVIQNRDNDGTYGITVTYVSNKNVTQRELIDVKDWFDGKARVELPLVPTLTTNVPVSASPGVTFSVSADLSDKAGALSVSPFKGKQIELVGKLKAGKRWSSYGKCKIGANGRCKVEAKIQKTTVFKFRPIKFSAAIDETEIKVK